MNAYLGSRAGKIRTEHDHPWCGVRELLSAGLEAILKELHVATSAVAAFLILDFVLYNKGLGLEVNGLGEGSRDSMMGSLALRNEALVAVNDGDRRVLDLPFTDVAEGLATDWRLLRCFRRCPAFSPVLCELLDKRSLDRGGLRQR